MSFKVGDVLNGVRIDIFESGTILKQLKGTLSFMENQELWIVNDMGNIIELKSGFTWTNREELGNFEILKLPG